MEDKYTSLYIRISKTGDSRFFASHRLNYHQKITIWSISISSAILVIISLLSVFQIQLNYEKNIVEFAQIVFAIIVLVYSLLLNNIQNPSRSEKLHRCALEVNNLSHDLFAYIGKEFSEEVYQDFSKKYHDIINRYDNHDPIDYLFTKLKRKEDFKVGKIERLIIYFRYSIGFIHYVFIVGSELTFLYLLIK